MLLPVKAQASHTEFDPLMNRFEQLYYTQATKSKLLIDEMYQLAHNNSDNISLLARCIYAEALLSYAQGSIDPTLTPRIKERITLTNKGNYPYEHALLHFSLGSHLSATGSYSEAFSASIEASESFKQLSDSLMVAKSLNVLGTICSHINMFTMSKNYYKEALEWITPENSEYYRIRHNFYRLDLLGSDMHAMIDSIKLSNSIFEHNQDTSMMISSYLNLGASYFKIGEFDTALDYWKKSEELLEKIDNSRFNSSLYQNLGAYYIISENDYERALDYFKQSLHISEKNRNLVHLSSLYDIISEIYDEMNDLGNAYHYLRKHQELNQQLILTPKAMEAYQDYVSTYLETTENKLTIAQQEIQIRKRHIMVILMIAFSLVLLTIIFLQQKRKKEIENKELSQQLEHEKKIKQIEKEKQEEVIEAKTREISSYSLLLSNKNNILKQILDLNGQLKMDKSHVHEISKKVDEIIKNNFNLDTEWTDFKMHFDKVHPRFFDKLIEHCPSLTENNLRLCAYFKIGMSTKQIAQILHISPSSVSINRHRLKKKFGLNEEDDLDVFIRNL